MSKECNKKQTFMQSEEKQKDKTLSRVSYIFENKSSAPGEKVPGCTLANRIACITSQSLTREKGKEQRKAISSYNDLITTGTKTTKTHSKEPTELNQKESQIGRTLKMGASMSSILMRLMFLFLKGPKSCALKTGERAARTTL